MRLRLSAVLLMLLTPGLLLAGPILPKCGCSGTDINGNDCSCTCNGDGCVCVCSVLDGCSCGSDRPAEEVSVDEGTTVGSAASKVSRAIGREVVVRAGADELIPHRIDNTTGWQVLARLSRLPGVKLTVKPKEILRTRGSTFAEKEQEVAAFPPTHVLSACSAGATLATVLDGISRHTGAAFDVVGDLSTKVDGQVKGTVQEVIRQLSAETGTSITLAAD